MRNWKAALVRVGAVSSIVMLAASSLSAAEPPAASPSAAAPSADPAAKAVVDRAVEAYAKLGSYQDKGKLSFVFKATMNGEAMDQGEDQAMTFVYKQPNLFALTADAVTLVGDGKTTTASSKDLKQYIQKPATAKIDWAAFAGPFAQSVAVHPAANILLSVVDTPTKFPILEEVTGVKPEVRDGVKGQLVSGKGTLDIGLPVQDKADVTVWFNDETGLAHHMSIDMTEVYKKFLGQMAAMAPDQPMPDISKFAVSVTFTEVKANPEVADSTFAYVAPEGFKKVDTFDFEAAMADMPPQDELVGLPAPVFSGTDVNSEALALKDFEGKVLVIDFWATWCGPCVQAMPHIQALHETYKDKGVVVLGMNHDRGNVEKVKSFIDKKSITFRQFMDGDGSVGKAYGVTGIPCTVMIDRKGIVQAIHVGFAPGQEKEYAEQIEKLLKGENLYDEAVVAARRKAAEAKQPRDN